MSNLHCASKYNGSWENFERNIKLFNEEIKEDLKIASLKERDDEKNVMKFLSCQTCEDDINRRRDNSEREFSEKNKMRNCQTLLYYFFYF